MNFAPSVCCLLLLCLLTGYAGFGKTPVGWQPYELKCELQKEAFGIDVANPDLSYIVRPGNTFRRDWRQTAYQVLVASTAELLNKNIGDLWDSRKKASSKMAYIKYSGNPLASSRRYWWKVRVWDEKNNVSVWSEPASWTMGILNEKDWKASWISAKGAEKFASTPFGFRFEIRDSSGPNWIQVDLEKLTPVNAIVIQPVFYEDRAGYGFPQNFKVELSDAADFSSSILLFEDSTGRVRNPGWKPFTIPVKQGVNGRYVRLTCLRNRNQPFNIAFALRQFKVYSGHINVAAGKNIESSSSEEKGGWSKNNLTDEPADWRALPNYSSMLFRKQFAVRTSLTRAVVHVSGLSEYELTLNGKKVGDYLLTPGWTDYRKTILYDTYDITNQIQPGENAMGIMTGNGMYNIQPDSIRYVKFLNSFGPQKIIAQLRLEYSDGSINYVVTDSSWQVSPGPITYSNMFGGEDYNANLKKNGWDRPGYTNDTDWRPVIITSGAGGKLKGLSAAAAPVKEIELLKPVKVTKLKENIWIYDFGQNASMMPYLRVKGLQGSSVRMIPSELLGQDGYVDRRSATQDGVRPAWWQYTLEGKAVEEWKPAFFYQGARYLQVELYPAAPSEELPVIQTLEDQVVHSSSAPIGYFESSNNLFNKIYQLVRWAQRSNMMSLMTDCPHREKMGWLEENHLNGPALRYNFDLALLFRKTMNDMADAQLPNGFVPNIAPEYFIAGSADLGNAMRNSPEWGSSFIIVPWQQYLFSGDISLLERYYDRMKRYVAFLQSTTKDNLTQIGLGDWYDIGPKEPWGSQLTPPPVTGTAILYYDTWIMSRVAILLGKPEDARKFSSKAEEIKTSFNKAFYNEAAGYYSTNSQTANAMPLYLNMVEKQNREKVTNAIVADIRARGNSLTSGDVGYRFLLQALAIQGRSDIIFDMNNQTDKPGYGYQLKMGATSLTEKWDAGVGNFGSQNHFMLGQINEWFFSNLIGLNTDETATGFRKFTIKPAITGDITWVKGGFHSISGEIMVEWKRKNKTLELTVTVPPNTRASIHLPATSPAVVMESGKPVMGKQGMKVQPAANNSVICEVGSGKYFFMTVLPD